MQPKRILLVEDEIAIAEPLIYVLNSHGFQVQHLTLARQALQQIQQNPFHLAILDVGLPDGNGFDLCRQIRQFSQLPILFLTARNDEIDRVVGLEIGADDYVTKPFSPREVAARVGAILRRYVSAATTEPSPLFDLDSAAGRIRYHGVVLELTRYEYLLLKELIEHPQRIFSREQLLERIWQEPGEVFDRTVDTHIKTLRAKLRSVAPDEDVIRTFRGMGYSLQTP